MPRDRVETVIKDSQGVDHKYTTIPFPFDKSVDLKLKILAIVARPIGDAVGELIHGAAVEGAAEKLGDLTTDPGASVNADALDGINWSKLGPIAEQIPSRLIEAGGAALLAEILADTVRYSKGGGDENRDLKLHLAKPINRDAAFSGGNHVEAYRAVAWILGVNYSPFSTGDSVGFQGLWIELKGWLKSIKAEASSDLTPKPAASTEPTSEVETE